MPTPTTIEVTTLRAAFVAGVGTLPSNPTVRAALVRLSDRRQLAVSPAIVRQMAEALGWTVTEPDEKPMPESLRDRRGA